MPAGPFARPGSSLQWETTPPTLTPAPASPIARTPQPPPSAPPDITAFGEEGETDNLWSHPGVSPRSTHFGGLVPLAGEAEVCDLEHRVCEVVVLNGLQDKDWEGGRKVGHPRASGLQTQASWPLSRLEPPTCSLPHLELSPSAAEIPQTPPCGPIPTRGCHEGGGASSGSASLLTPTWALGSSSQGR